MSGSCMHLGRAVVPGEPDEGLSPSEPPKTMRFKIDYS